MLNYRYHIVHYANSKIGGRRKEDGFLNEGWGDEGVFIRQGVS